MIPFFVADRPMSLRIIKGLPLAKYPNVQIGIMAHANTSRNFQEGLRKYPCENLSYCDAIGEPCQYPNNIEVCPVRNNIVNQTVKMCDSGIFTRQGATLTYKQLFEVYSRMNVDYGIMIDVFQDSQATLDSAKIGLKIYQDGNYQFKFVVVAQGNSLDEYLNSYAQLKELGCKYIAVGGLLRRHANTVRYATLRSRKGMFEILDQLHQQYPNDWLFALGCFHPSRLAALEKLGVWADYKGWIFQYKKRNANLNEYIKTFISKYREESGEDKIIEHYSSLHQIISQREQLVVKQKELSQNLLKGRRVLRLALSNLYQKLQNFLPEEANTIKSLVTRALLTDTDKKNVLEIISKLDKQNLEDLTIIVDDIEKNHEISAEIKYIENEINCFNVVLAEEINNLIKNNDRISEATKIICIQINKLIKITEQEHRLEQVRNQISEKILKPLLY